MSAPVRTSLGVWLIALVAASALAFVPPRGDRPAEETLRQPSPLEAMRQFDAEARAGNLDRVVRAYFAVDEPQRRFARTCAEADIALAQLQQSVTDRFGRLAGEDAIHAAGQQTLADLQAAKIDVQGNQATITWADGSDPLALIFVEGRWCVSIDSLTQKLTPPEVSRLGRKIHRLSEAIRQISARVETGDFKTADELTQHVSTATDQILAGADDNDANETGQ
jgi:hypothetical protein